MPTVWRTEIMFAGAGRSDGIHPLISGINREALNPRRFRRKASSNETPASRQAASIKARSSIATPKPRTRTSGSPWSRPPISSRRAISAISKTGCGPAVRVAISATPIAASTLAASAAESASGVVTGFFSNHFGTSRSDARPTPRRPVGGHDHDVELGDRNPPQDLNAELERQASLDELLTQSMVYEFEVHRSSLRI